MHIQRLAYIGIHATDLPTWRQFASSLLGMDVRDVAVDTLVLRMDDKASRFIVHKSEKEGGAYYGWEVDGLSELDEVRYAVQQYGLQVRTLSDDECAVRSIESGIAFYDPLNNVVEVATGHMVALDDLRLGRPISGFKTGDLGLGHVVLGAQNVEEAECFYRDVLGFKLSDRAQAPFAASFYHVNGRHHSLAFVQTPNKPLHHIMVETLSLDDVGQAYDLVQGNPPSVGATLGRHTNDFMTSFYVFTPSRFMIEYGWGGRVIDEEHWQPYQLEFGPSLWGHDRTWLPEEKRQEARDLRLSAARHGAHAPVQVTPGHFNQLDK